MRKVFFKLYRAVVVVDCEMKWLHQKLQVDKRVNMQYCALVQALEFLEVT